MTDELERIRAAYRERDRRPGRAKGAAGGLYQQELERQVTAALSAAGVALADGPVLDVGAGDGFLLSRLAALGARDTIGVELVPERVAMARDRHPDVDVRCASATALPFDAGTFTVVTQFTVLSSVLDPGVRHRIAAEMLRVLRPGGVVVSYDLRPSPRLLRALRRRFGGPPADFGTPTEALSADELRRLFGPLERLRTVQLNLDLAELVGGRRPVVAALRRLPPLRSHLLATVRAR